MERIGENSFLLRLFIWFFISYFFHSCTQDNENMQNVDKSNYIQNSKNVSIEEFLIQFYSDYVNISLPYDDLRYLSKKDSLSRYYCTKSFYQKLSRDFNKDHDFITNDYFMTNHSIETLEVEKKMNYDSVYVVSFDLESDEMDGDVKIEKVSFDVTIKEEEGRIKIDNVCCF